MFFKLLTYFKIENLYLLKKFKNEDTFDCFQKNKK